MDYKEELVKKYSQASKHSNYQILPEKLKKILGDKVDTKSRYEAERLKFILSKINFQNKTVLDIGGNTGYFTFELVEAGAKKVHCYEGNKEHADFVELAAKALDLRDKVDVTAGYYTFDDSNKASYDVILLFNVLHHVGDDYGNRDIDSKQAKPTILAQLNSLAKYTDELVFQLGFNWQGDVNKPLFENGTKQELIEYVRDGVQGSWDIVSIGIAEKQSDKIIYQELNDKNIERDDSMGEFLNRPIFILKSKRNH
jgi:SAM-dependent methyltransferase